MQAEDAKEGRITMKLKKYLNLFILLAIFAIALSMVTVKAYAKEKTSSVKLLK